MTPELLTPESATQAAEQAALWLLRSSPRWQPALATRTALPPLLVQRLDRDDYDYIVQFEQAQGVTARLLIHAFSGELGEASGVETEGAKLLPYVTPRLEPFIGKAFDLPAVASRVIRAGTVGIHPVLGWKPCKESTSPFLPFYLLSVGDAIVYWRVDDVRFDRLTEGFA